MVDLEKLAELDTTSSGGPWKLCKHLQSVADDRSCSCGFPGDVWAGDGERVLFTMGPLRDRDHPDLDPATPGREETINNAHLIVELRNNVSAIVGELRAARELAERLRFVLSGGPTIVGRGGDLDELLEKYEAARDGGGK